MSQGVDDGYTCVEFRLTPYTPWWGGDYTTATIQRDTCTVAPLTSDTVKGVMRWVARALAASVIENGENYAISDIDRLIQHLFGGVRDRGRSCSSLVILDVMSENEDVLKKSCNTVVRSIEQGIKMIFEDLKGLGDCILNAVSEVLTSKKLQVRDLRIREARFLIEVGDAVARNIFNYVEKGRLNLSEEREKLLNSIASKASRDVMDAIANMLRQIVEGIPKSKSPRSRRDLRREFDQELKNAVKEKCTSIAARHIHTILSKVTKDNPTVLYLLLIFTIPRFKLLALGAQSIDELMKYLPIPYVSYYRENEDDFVPTFKLKLCVDRLSATLRGISYLEVLRLAVVTLALASVLIGFGKASSRGFGRFLIEPKDYPNELKDVIDLIKRVKESLSNGDVYEFKKAIDDVISAGISAMLSLVTPLLKEQKPRLRIIEGSSTPSFKSNYFEIHIIPREGPLIHPLPIHPQLLSCKVKKELLKRRTHVKDLLVALSALGSATLKVVWKLYCCAKPDTVGQVFNTWILGLPRTQKGTGYKLSSGEGRRKSPIVLLPLCGENECKISIIVFRTYRDHISNIVSYKLCHVGEHDKIRLPIKVEKILTSSMNIAVKCCDSRSITPQGGIVLPLDPADTDNKGEEHVLCRNCIIDRCNKIDGECIDKVLHAAIEFIEKALSHGIAKGNKD